MRASCVSVVVLSALLGLQACGNKSDLYLPDQNPQAQSEIKKTPEQTDLKAIRAQQPIDQSTKPNNRSNQE